MISDVTLRSDLLKLISDLLQHTSTRLLTITSDLTPRSDFLIFISDVLKADMNMFLNNDT